MIKFSELKEWGFNNRTGNLEHFSKKFFSVIGLDIKTNWGEIYNWQQPIIKQSEIGILGIITKRFDQKSYYLMQAKIEPGNINHVQISPTLQATKSNYLQVHNGKKPKYLGYFFDNSKKLVIDQLQSEQGARFYKKRNRNIIIEINSKDKNISINDVVVSEFDEITLDGHSGEVFEGIAKTKIQEPTSDLKEILDWCKGIISDEEITDPLKIISKAKLKLE